MTGTEAPRGGAARRARTDQRLAEAVARRLEGDGYAGLTIEGVAATSGIAKTTIYRRWASKAEMVFDLVIHRSDHAPPIDTGTLAGDVRELAERAIDVIAGPRGQDVIPGLLADMTRDAQLAARLRQTFSDAARDDIAGMLDRGLHRGELTAAPDAEEFHAALLGIPFAYVHLLDLHRDGRMTDRLTGHLLRMLGYNAHDKPVPDRGA